MGLIVNNELDLNSMLVIEERENSVYDQAMNMSSNEPGQQNIIQSQSVG